MGLYLQPPYRHESRRRFIPGLSSSTQSYSYTASGGLTFGGSGASARVAARSATGGLSLSGSVQTSLTFVWNITGGGISFGGTAPYANSGIQHYSYTASGGLSFSGAAARLRRIVRAPSGGLLLSGVSPELRKRVAFSVGGIVFGGSAGYSNTNQNSYAYSPTGGFVISGAASRAAVRIAAISGGISISGAPDKRTIRIATISGGIVFGGSAGYTNTSLQALVFLADRLIKVRHGGPNLFFQRSNEALLYGFDWTNAMEAGINLVDVTYQVPSPLVNEFSATDAGNRISAIRISGIPHGRLYAVHARAHLSNGEYVSDVITVRGFDS